MSEDTLCVGDSVCLYATESYGFVMSTQSSSVHNEVAVGCRQDRVKPDIKDQHIISFTLRVANRYKLNKKFNKQQTKLEAEPENILLRTQVAHAKLAADSENDDNNLEQKRQQGKKVVYGQVIQVELLESNAKHCQFKIMPRYKVKAEGDVVGKLESMKSPGSFLHVSKAFLGPMSVYSKSFELNLSVQQTGFTVYRKYKPHIEDDNKVRVGDIIRFYHKEMEAYLVAEGLFDDELLEDVHLRMRPMDQNNPKTLFPSTSAVTYWQIELQTGPIDGGVLKWEQQCRIIHMCSRKYLTVDKALQKVTLTGDHMDPNTVFRIHPVIREYDEVPLDSYCRIEHVVSKRWLHALTVDYVRKCAQQEEDSSMGSLKWSTATLKQISTIEEKQYDDAFTIQGVSSDLVEIFDYMAGMVPFIQKLIGDKKDGVQLNAKMTHDAVVALSELKDFMIVDSLPNKNRQKLMRNLRIVELLVYLLQIPFRGTADQHHLTRIFVEAYDVLYTYLKGDSRKNELYIAKYIDFFLSQFEYKEGMIGLNSAHMVMELIKDNRKIVDRITTEHIDKFVELLRRDKNYRYLDLLKVLCVCDGVSIADNQKYITEVWLMKGNRNCVFYTDLGQKIGKEKGVVYVSTTTGRTWMELSKFAQKSSNDDELYLFLEHQLELFGYLCNGQNDFSIKVITQELNYLTWDEAFTCVSDDRLPDELRAQYCDLIITMFVNVGDNHSVIDRVKLTYNYDEIDDIEDLADLSHSITSKYFPTLSEWIAKFLGQNSDMTASEIGNNKLVKQVLRLVHFLVAFGFYQSTEDIMTLLEPMMGLIDGRNDKPYPVIPPGKEGEEVLKNFRQHERYHPSQETQAVVDAKCQALEVLDLFFNFIFNVRLEKFMNTFKLTHTAANRPNLPHPELAPMLYETYDLSNQHGPYVSIPGSDYLLDGSLPLSPPQTTSTLTGVSTTVSGNATYPTLSQGSAMHFGGVPTSTSVTHTLSRPVNSAGTISSVPGTAMGLNLPGSRPPLSYCGYMLPNTGTQPLPSWSQPPWPQSYPYGGFMPNQPGFWPYRDNFYGPPSGVATAPPLAPALPVAVSLTSAVAPSTTVPDSQASSSSHGTQVSDHASPLDGLQKLLLDFGESFKAEFSTLSSRMTLLENRVSSHQPSPAKSVECDEREDDELSVSPGSHERAFLTDEDVESSSSPKVSKKATEPSSKSVQQPPTKETEDPPSLKDLRDKVYTLMTDEAHITFCLSFQAEETFFNF
ncbi:unnamed protein product [Mytilus edulis]|uniref:Inositol 1,4,5-trisphosphate receptor n=1 Tax=Mytilus edulis TaxID=6550 RepID=A0A8S3SWL2_MYTED|nr:unnamed protein product [Mytilus edulis]